jgi:hypothetical protein
MITGAGTRSERPRLPTNGDPLVLTHTLTRKRLAAGLTAGLAALLLAGCGGDDAGSGSDSGSGTAASSSSSSSSSAPEDERTGTEVAAAAADALEEAGAAHVTGTIGTGADAQGVDLQLQGDDATGTITLGGQTVQLITVGGASYFQAGAEFWVGSGVPQVAADQLAGQWVVVPADEADSFAELTLSGLAEQFRSPDGEVVDEVSTEQLDGAEVLVVTQTGGKKLYVAAGDPAYPLRLESTGEDAGTVDFSGFGELQQITAPEAPLDLEQLGG